MTSIPLVCARRSASRSACAMRNCEFSRVPSISMATRRMAGVTGEIVNQWGAKPPKQELGRAPQFKYQTTTDHGYSQHSLVTNESGQTLVYSRPTHAGALFISRSEERRVGKECMFVVVR